MFTASCGYGEGGSWAFHPGCYTTDNIKNIKHAFTHMTMYVSEEGNGTLLLSKNSKC